MEKSTLSIKETLSITFRTLKILFHAAPGGIAFLGILSTIAGVCPFLTLILSRAFLDSLARACGQQAFEMEIIWLLFLARGGCEGPGQESDSRIEEGAGKYPGNERCWLRPAGKRHSVKQNHNWKNLPTYFPSCRTCCAGSSRQMVAKRTKEPRSNLEAGTTTQPGSLERRSCASFANAYRCSA